MKNFNISCGCSWCFSANIDRHLSTLPFVHFYLSVSIFSYLQFAHKKSFIFQKVLIRFIQFKLFSWFKHPFCHWHCCCCCYCHFIHLPFLIVSFRIKPDKTIDSTQQMNYRLFMTFSSNTLSTYPYIFCEDFLCLILIRWHSIPDEKAYVNNSIDIISSQYTMEWKRSHWKSKSHAHPSSIMISFLSFPNQHFLITLGGEGDLQMKRINFVDDSPSLTHVNRLKCIKFLWHYSMSIYFSTREKE